MTGYASIGGISSPIAEYGVAQVSVTHPSPAELVTVVGTGSTDLIPNTTDFVQVLDAFTEQLNKGPVFTTQANGQVLVNRDGVVKITAYADVSHSSNNSTVGAAFSITRNAVPIITGRSVHAKMPNSGDIGHISGVGSFDAFVGDLVGIALASDISGDVSIRSSSLVFEYLGNYE